MAMEKRSTPRKAAKPERTPQITPMPFPGESPTVALAMAAAEKYGVHPEDVKPAAKRKPARAAKRKAPRARKAPARSRAR